MAETRKVLGQLAPAATTLSALYTVPGATQAVISTINVCETGGASALIRISVAVAGAADAIAQYLIRDATLQANQEAALTIGATLGAADVVRVYSSTGNVSFSAFGVELT